MNGITRSAEIIHGRDCRNGFGREHGNVPKYSLYRRGGISVRLFADHLTLEILAQAEEDYLFECFTPWELAVEQFIQEGAYDPGILKCVMFAGGPGSGKSFVASELFGLDTGFRSTFSHYGLKVVNSDHMFEYLLKKIKVSPKNLGDIERDDPKKFKFLTFHPEGPRQRAREITRRQQQMYMAGKLGMILDGTGDDYEKVEKKRDKARDAGYDTCMVFVNTSLVVAHERNQGRSRQLPDSIVEKLWQACQRNRSRFKQLFEMRNYTEVHNTKGGVVHASVGKAVHTFIKRPVQNPKGIAWLRSQGL